MNTWGMSGVRWLIRISQTYPPGSFFREEVRWLRGKLLPCPPLGMKPCLGKILYIISFAYYIVYYHSSLVKASVILLPLLGLTWVFGLFAINDNTVVFAWLFTVFNSLQVYMYSLWACRHSSSTIFHFRDSSFSHSMYFSRPRYV